MATKRPQTLHHEPEAVIYARQKAGLSKTQLAEELGVSLSLISMIEKGDRSATPALLQQMARILNCPLVVLERKRLVASPVDPAEDENGGDEAA